MINTIARRLQIESACRLQWLRGHDAGEDRLYGVVACVWRVENTHLLVIADDNDDDDGEDIFFLLAVLIWLAFFALHRREQHMKRKRGSLFLSVALVLGREGKNE